MKDLLLVAGFLVFWITLNRWLLPWFGIQTCMSGACCSKSASQPCSLEKAGMPAERVQPGNDDPAP